MSQVNHHDVEAIKEWLAKEPHLPNAFDDEIIKKFLFSCNSSLERTKKCIEEFLTRRVLMPEVYTDRDPTSKRMQNAFAATTCTAYIAGDDEVLIHQLIDTQNFDFYDFIKAFTILADNWIKYRRDVLPENQVIVLDIKEYTLRLVAKSNIFFYQKFVNFLLESMPVRLKHVHVINCPSYYDYLYNLVKPALPEYLIQMIHFHTDHTGLHKFIDKKYLPQEYGGDAESMVEQTAVWVNQVIENRKFYLDDNYWKAEKDSKKTKGGDIANAMSGSFRTLAID